MYGYSNGRYEAAPIHCYRQAKQRYEEVKPIRGRSGDIRPLGKRRRDWERIVKVSESAYAIRLYSTDVVTYYEDGAIELRTGGWASVSTAEMISLHSPFYATKRNKQVWVWHSDKHKYIVPADINECLRMVRVDGVYEPETPQVLRQRVVDRTGIKELREKISPFIKFTKTMLALSDGWINVKSMLELGGKKINGWRKGRIIYPDHFTADEWVMLERSGNYLDRNARMAKMFVDVVSRPDEDQWLRVMYTMLTTNRTPLDEVVEFYEPVEGESASRINCPYMNQRFDVSEYVELINKILRVHPDAQTVRELPPGSEFRSNVV
jgi:hypothetical protein